MSSVKTSLEIGSSPHITSGASVDVIMRNVVYALLPVCVFAVYAFGLAAGNVRQPIERLAAIPRAFNPSVLFQPMQRDAQRGIGDAHRAGESGERAAVDAVSGVA